MDGRPKTQEAQKMMLNESRLVRMVEKFYPKKEEKASADAVKKKKYEIISLKSTTPQMDTDNSNALIKT